MFDMGFEPQIMRIVNNIRPDRQTVLFSATFPRQVEALARTILADPVEIQVGGCGRVGGARCLAVGLLPSCGPAAQLPRPPPPGPTKAGRLAAAAACRRRRRAAQLPGRRRRAAGCSRPAPLRPPCHPQVGGRSVVNADITQMVELRPEEDRFLRLLELLGEWYELGKIIIFVHSQDKCDSLFRDLLKSGYPCLSLHGGKDQADRECTIADFKGNVCNILVATSVAARGLDVKDLVLVVNHDVPNHHEDYVHRVGRTGRAGNKGTAITFIAPDEERYAPDLVKALRESGAPVPEDLQAMADAFGGKRKAGLVQAHGSGYGGSGFKFDASEEDLHKQARKAEAKKYGAEQAEASGSDSDDDDIRVAGTAAAAAAAAATRARPPAAAEGGGGGGGAEGQPAAGAEGGPQQPQPQPTGHVPAAPQTNQELLVAAQRAAAQLTGNASNAAANFAAMAAQRAAALAAAWGHTSAPPSSSGGGGGGGGVPAFHHPSPAPQFETTLEINDFPQHARWKVRAAGALRRLCRRWPAGLRCLPATCAHQPAAAPAPCPSARPGCRADAAALARALQRRTAPARDRPSARRPAGSPRSRPARSSTHTPCKRAPAPHPPPPPPPRR
jgi:superfamily II DNA/RNA helicase